MPTDFRDGRTFPRRGRTPMGEYLWLARVFDKARAAANGTIHDYIYPCPMDRGVFARWGITSDEFDDAVRNNKDDSSIHEWARKRVPQTAADAANRWLLDEKTENLDRQDREENVT
jgi:hypothetical protein